MQRRLFLNRAAVGLLLPLLPQLAFGETALLTSSEHAAARTQLAGWLSQLGDVEQVQLDYAYSPGHTSQAALFEQLRADVGLLAGPDAVVHFTEPKPNAARLNASFGSFSHTFQHEGVAVRCRFMARIGQPEAPLQRRCRVLGTLGVVDSANGHYAHLDLAGRVLQQGTFLTHLIA